MLHSPEFWSPKAYRAKLKTPLEFVVSAVRGQRRKCRCPDALVQNLTAMGMQPYGMASSDRLFHEGAETWDNKGALLARINSATALTQGKMAGVQFDPAGLARAVGILADPGSVREPGPSSAKSAPGLDFAMPWRRKHPAGRNPS